MKTKILTLLAASCFFFFNACSEESESLADKCKDNNGVSEGCVVGTWSLKGIYAKADNSVITNYSNAPGTLVITDDGKFEYTMSAAPQVDTDCGGQKVYGTWEIIDASLKFSIKTGDCVVGPITASPRVDELQMNLNGVFFQLGDVDDESTKANGTEILDRVE
ncbi:MAG: hypothetical protein IKC23_06850 [Fibrobacter sp.]|nr:hypothetical protein [Fibrobacter sp.]MBR2899320.1 hypothetical protein [Fibrobacter sp.]